MKTTAFFTRILGWLTGSRLTVENSVVKELDLNRFVGSWYEVACFEHSLYLQCSRIIQFLIMVNEMELQLHFLVVLGWLTLLSSL